jgi:hypothetical protein
VAGNQLKIPKSTREVSLWVHPEGQVIGSLFLREHSIHHAGPEQPIEVLNQDTPFIVVQRQNPDELRFYNRNAIVRVEHAESDESDPEDQVVLPCRLTLMDGSVFGGEIRETLPPDQARLFDYLNLETERFIKLHLDGDRVCLLNKSYIIHITTEAGHG